MANKICRVCGVEKPEDQFAEKRNTCKSCRNAHRNAQLKQRYENDEGFRNKTKARTRQWAIDHPDKVKARYENRTSGQIERDRARAKQWGRDHPDIARERARQSHASHRVFNNMRRKQWSLDHPDITKENARKWRINHPDERRESHRKSKANRQGIPITEESLRYIDFLTRCGIQECDYCGRDCLPEVEHLIPVCRGGTYDISNLARSCAECNHGVGGKWTMTLEEFADSGKMKLPLSEVMMRIEHTRAEFMSIE